MTGFSVHADEERDLRATVQQWLDTMAAVQKEEDEWTRDKEILQNHRAGLKAEIDTLTRQLKDAQGKAGQANKEEADQLKKKEGFTSAQQALSDEVIKLENRMASILHLIPPPLKEADKVKAALMQLEKTLATKDRSDMTGVPGRLQTVLILMKEMEKFQSTITVRKAFQKASDGKEYEMQIIYLGLAKAYSVNATGTIAQVGEPTPEGWTFQEDNSIATHVRTLVDTTTGDGDAQFVNIPLSIR